MEYTVNIYEPKIYQKIATLLELQIQYMPVSEDLKNTIEPNNLLNSIINSEDFEKLLDADIALFEVQN